MSFLHLADKIRMRFGRYKVGAPTTNSQPGAHTGSSRQYIPGYSDSNIVYLDTASGNDSNDGSTELLAKLTYASAATAAGSTKKIRVINDGATLSTNITKPTEMKRGVSGTISSSTSAPVDAWTQAATPSFATTLIEAVAWSPKLKLFVAVGQSGKVATSSDGNTWTQQTAIFSGAQVLDITWDNISQRFYCVGNNGAFAYSIDGETWSEKVISEIEISLGSYNINCVLTNSDASLIIVATNAGTIASSSDGGETWLRSNTTLSGDSFLGGCWSERLGKFYITTFSGGVYYSSDGVNWAAAIAPSFSGDPIYWITDSAQVGKLVAVGGSFSTPKLAYSTDGDTFTQSATPAMSGARANYVEYCVELGKYVAAGNGGQLAFSSDGDTWTLAATPSFSTTAITDVSYSPLIGKLTAVGGSGKIAYSTAFANTISANIAGFTVQAMQYSGTVTAYNCTMYQPGTTAALSLNACRFTEPGAHIANNAQSHFGTLFEGDAFFTSAPASQNAFALNCNTFGGNVYLYNSSATNYEQIRDNVIVGDFTASFAAPMLSGNLQGTNTNGILAKAVTLSDPAFVNTTDYKLKRLTNGDSQDSPLCNAAVYYVNEQGEPRDMGAWSEDDSENAVDYRYSYFIDKPAGNGIRPQKIVAASADQGMDGTWDSVNEPERASEYLTITYSAAVSREHVTIQDLMESLIDMTCEVSLTPDLSDPDTAVTVNGNHSIGDIVLNIDASSTIKAGMVLPIGGVNYFILYTASGSSPTKLVLHKPLESAVSDNTVITPQEPAAYGTYQYIPQSREIPRPTKMETDYVNGVSFKFVRQYPQV